MLPLETQRLWASAATAAKLMFWPELDDGVARGTCFPFVQPLVPMTVATQRAATTTPPSLRERSDTTSILTTSIITYSARFDGVAGTARTAAFYISWNCRLAPQQLLVRYG